MFPILFTIGPFNVYAFGFFLAVAFILATFIVWKYAKEELKEEEYLDSFLYTAIALIISARVWYILLHFEQFGLNVLRYIVVRETPGLSLTGGLLGGFLFLFWYSKKKKYDLFHLLDLFSLSGCFALILAKIGEQLGGAGFGKETQLSWGVKIVGLPGRHHPTELYEASLLFVLFLLLYFVYRRVIQQKYPSLLVFCLFALGLALIIFLLEFLKTYPVYLYGLSLRQFSALAIIILVIGPFWQRFKGVRRLNL